MKRDHGGNLAHAMAQYGTNQNWIDLSTGINPVAYDVPQISASAWAELPQVPAFNGLYDAVRGYLGADFPITAAAGAQAIIQLVPQIFSGKRAKVLGPTYNEHAACLIAQGWQVEMVTHFDDLSGADLAVIVNPNNPDGRFYGPQQLLDLRPKVGAMVVDESFGDITPEISVSIAAPSANILVLRSFGKFFGLAGLRLGFAIGPAELVDKISGLLGPWPVSGPALEIATRAYGDRYWISQTRQRLTQDHQHLDVWAKTQGWDVVGGCDLFGLYATPDAAAAQHKLAQNQIWSRIFPYSQNWIRLGLPGFDWQWDRLKALG